MRKIDQEDEYISQSNHIHQNYKSTYLRPSISSCRNLCCSFIHTFVTYPVTEFVAALLVMATGWVWFFLGDWSNKLWIIRAMKNYMAKE